LKAGDRFTRTIALDWAEVRDAYFEALRKITFPFLDLFPLSGQFDRSTLLTRRREHFRRLSSQNAAF
jgi:hypothetical protein